VSPEISPKIMAGAFNLKVLSQRVARVTFRTCWQKQIQAMNSLFILPAFLLYALADDVVVSWAGGCGGNNGFNIAFSATNGGTQFKPDAAMGATVPCDEYFECNGKLIFLLTI
jgi:hypothetical protein